MDLDMSWLFNKNNLTALWLGFKFGMLPALIALPFIAVRLLWNRFVEREHPKAKQPTTREKGLALERELATLFRALGYQVQLTPPQGDWGVDLIVEQKGRRWAIQAKNWKQRVGVEAVQQVHTGRDFYGCYGARVVAPAGFTAEAEHMAAVLGVELWDKRHLAALRQQVQRIAATRKGEAGRG